MYLDRPFLALKLFVMANRNGPEISSAIMSSTEQMAVRCPTCERYVSAKVHGEHLGGDPDDAYRHLLLICPECADPFLMWQRGTVEYNSFSDSMNVVWVSNKVLYPSQPDRLSPSVPQNIAISYLEAQRCFSDASGYTASAIMCRRTLEGICEHFSASGGNLKNKLQDLKNRNVIDPKVHEWADDILRGLGNDAAHDIDATITKEDTRDALEFTRAIIEYLFVFQSAFETFKERRKKAKTAEESTTTGDELPS